MYCEEWALVKYEETGRRVKPLLCRTWGCPNCTETRIKDLKGLARRGEPNRFLTLTVRCPPGFDTGERARALVAAFVALRKRIARAFPRLKMEFLAVFEIGKQGKPHIHVLMRGGWLSQKWLSDAMGEILDSPHVDIRAIDDSGRVASYVAKYITKAPARIAGCKRYWRSKNYELAKNKWTPPTLPEGTGWRVIQRSPLSLVFMFRNQGYVDRREGKTWIMERPP